MRYILIFGIIILSILMGCNVNKNSLVSKAEEKQASYCYLKKFSGRVIEGKIYLNWEITSNINNYYFVVEKITDSAKKEIVSVQKGYPSPGQTELLFCFIDEDTATYKEITYKLSAVIPIKNGPQLLLYPENKNLFQDNPYSEIKIYNPKQNKEYTQKTGG